ncbi:hypothetical protein Vqi01_34180 [Micromonospora qiuiae]|uniref:Uncharacterized protein n=1 Tax=Micromonospora qiuiae TaxID=502268 RepID=A0ABQ4JDJ8_9ACTN|nr:hypothetical protein Vqi01_34180 [Micromonospora qiuiae]
MDLVGGRVLADVGHLLRDVWFENHGLPADVGASPPLAREPAARQPPVVLVNCCHHTPSLVRCFGGHVLSVIEGSDSRLFGMPTTLTLSPPISGASDGPFR